ncbi:MAG: DUF4129 domain-containing protein [Caldilineaceae bacterium]
MTANNNEINEVLQPDSIIYDQGWLASWLRPTLLALMVACLNLTLLIFLRRFIPELGAQFTLVVAILGIISAVVGSTTSTWLAQPGQRLRRSAAYRGAEIALLLLVTRLAVWITAGTWPTLRAFFTHPLSTLFDGLFLLAAAIVTISWVIAGEMSRDLLDMALQPDELLLVQPDGRGDGMRAVGVDRRVLMNSFVVRWVVGGLLLIIFAAGATVEVGNFRLAGLAQLEIPGIVVLAIVVYFLAGLLLISQAQLAILRARWALEHAPTVDAVTRQWPLYVGTVLILIGALAALMPLGGTYWLSRIVAGVIGGIYMLFFTIFQIIAGLFILLLSLLPFSGREATPPPEAAQPIIPQTAPTPPSEFLEWAGGAAFWIIAALLLGYLAMVYFTDKGVRFGWLTLIWTMLRTRWQQWRATWRGWQQNRIRSRQDEGDAGSAAQQRARRRWPWQRNGTPEAQVRALYFAALDAAQEAGHPRRQAETPNRFAPRLAADMEDAEATEAVDALTDAFVHVRYGHREVTDADLSRLDALWQRLRRALRST